MKNSFLLTLLILSSIASCSDYPKLENGLYAEIKTNKGTMVAQLFYDKAPAAVSNFVSLAEGTNPLVDSVYSNKPFYDGVSFHRIIKDFMIQGGDPTGTGRGGPGYTFHDEFNPELKHDTIGVLSMINSGYATNGSQFFITVAPTRYLNGYDRNNNLKNCKNPEIGCHTVFGQLILGFDVLRSITQVEMMDTQRGKPKNQVTIQSLKIIRKGKKARNFEAPQVFKREIDKKAEEQAIASQKRQKLKKHFSKNNVKKQIVYPAD